MPLKAPVGLVLSGGGYLGVAHIGAIKALEEMGIHPTTVSGTSAGALVASLYAAGYSWQEMFEFFDNLELFSFSFNKFTLLKPGLIDTIKFYDEFKKYFPEDNFSALKKRLFIVATNMISGQARIFYEGPLIKPLLASGAFPGIFTPVEIDGVLYSDGGITNNFPTEPLAIYCEQSVGVFVSPLESSNHDSLNSTMAVTQRAFTILRAQASIKKFSDCDVIIAPMALRKYSFLKKDSTEEIFELGYQETLKKLKNLEQGKNPKAV